MMMTLKRTEDWLNSVDRGELWRVNDTTYMVFQSMEEVVRAYLRRSNIWGLSLPGGKDLLISKITPDEDIQFHWCVAAAAFWKEEGKILLNMIIEQKSNALRSELFSNTSTSSSVANIDS